MKQMCFQFKNADRGKMKTVGRVNLYHVTGMEHLDVIKVSQGKVKLYPGITKSIGKTDQDILF